MSTKKNWVQNTKLEKKDFLFKIQLPYFEKIFLKIQNPRNNDLILKLIKNTLEKQYVILLISRSILKLKVLNTVSRKYQEFTYRN